MTASYQYSHRIVLLLLLQLHGIFSFSSIIAIESNTTSYKYNKTCDVNDWFLQAADDDDKKVAAQPPKKRARSDGDTNDSDSDTSNNDSNDDDIVDLFGNGLKLVLDSLPDEDVKEIKSEGIKPAGPNGCTFPSTMNLKRADGIDLTPAKVARVVKRVMRANHQLNMAPNPLNPNRRYAVTVDPVSELVVGVSIVTLHTYLGIMSAYEDAADRFYYRANIDEHLRFITQRGFYYKHEKKHIADLGLYFDQTESNKHLKMASNFVCMPRVALGYHASVDAFFMGPEGVSITREDDDYVDTGMSRWDIWKINTSKGAMWPIEQEWIEEHNGIVPLRRFVGLEKVKCFVLFEDEQTYLDIGTQYTRRKGCISVWTHGSPAANIRWFAKAIYIRKRDKNQPFTMYAYGDMDYGGIKFAHSLSVNKFGHFKACHAEYGFTLECKWLFHYTSYVRFRHDIPTLPGHQEGAVINTMTLSERQEELILAYLNNQQQVLDAAGNGQDRRIEILAILEDDVRLNTAQVDVIEALNNIDPMMEHAIG